jgi:hypothetical protein
LSVERVRFALLMDHVQSPSNIRRAFVSYSQIEPDDVCREDARNYNDASWARMSRESTRAHMRKVLDPVALSGNRGCRTAMKVVTRNPHSRLDFLAAPV